MEKKFIERAKLSKRAKRELDASRRVTWDFSPVTRKVESKKRYDRNKKSRTGYDEYGAGYFYAVL